MTFLDLEISPFLVQLVDPVVQLVDPVVQLVDPVVQLVNLVAQIVNPVAQMVTYLDLEISPFLVQLVDPVVQLINLVAQMVDPVAQMVDLVAQPDGQTLAVVQQAPLPSILDRVLYYVYRLTSQSGALDQLPDRLEDINQPVNPQALVQLVAQLEEIDHLARVPNLHQLETLLAHPTRGPIGFPTGKK